MKILVVDDSSTMRKIVTRTLRQAGYAAAQVVEAADGREALEALDEASVDLIVSDVNMPHMNGLELVKALRERDDSATTPVVMVMTEGGHGAMGEAMSLGANAYVIKPFTSDQLKSVLGEVLS